MTPEIIRKLHEFLTSHVPFKEECEAVYLMVEVRKLLDREHPRDRFAKVRFYCDWMVHTQKDRNQDAIRDSMEELNDCLNNDSQHPQEDFMSFFSLVELRKEMFNLFEIHGLRTQVCQDDRYWNCFVDVFIQVLSDQPITNPINGISSIAFVPEKKGTKSVSVEFSDQRPPGTFGDGIAKVV
jgi:hypothetical protein